MPVIEVTSYDPNWPTLFKREAEAIKRALQGTLTEIHHIGSTSVPGLAAKPTIDLIVVVTSFAGIENALQKAGYHYKGEYNLPMRQFYEKPASPKIHAHVHLKDSPEIELNLTFRNALRACKALCDQYAHIKRAAAQKPEALERSAHTGIPHYNLVKNPFIVNVLKNSGFKGRCMRLCTQKEEWAAYHRLRRELLFAPAGRIYDETHPSLSDPATKHLVFIEGTEICAAGSLEWRDTHTVILRTLVVDANKQNRGIGRQFLEKIEAWARFHGAQKAYLNANKSAILFYQKWGYEKMSFADESLMPNTSQMGKTLISFNSVQSIVPH